MKQISDRFMMIYIHGWLLSFNIHVHTLQNNIDFNLHKQWRMIPTRLTKWYHTPYFISLTIP